MNHRLRGRRLRGDGVRRQMYRAIIASRSRDRLLTAGNRLAITTPYSGAHTFIIAPRLGKAIITRINQLQSPDTAAIRLRLCVGGNRKTVNADRKI